MPVHPHSGTSVEGMKTRLLLKIVLGAVLWGDGLAAQAQWLTQSITVKPGWSAVYLHVDASDRSVDQVVGDVPGNPITQIWLWQPPIGTRQYLTDPRSPLNGGSLWATWYHPSLGRSNTFNALIPNSAYLVYSPATNNYTWNLKGKPTPPNYVWDLSGLNLIGFPTPASAPPRFDAFWAANPEAASTTVELYQYAGANPGADTPVRVFSMKNTLVQRGDAFWMRATNVNAGFVVNNAYFGPLQLSLPNPTGLDFGDRISQFSLRLRNASASNLTVTLSLLESEAAPGRVTPPPLPQLLVRGELTGTNLTYPCSVLNHSNLTWTLPPQGGPGSDIAVVLGLNRRQMTNLPGTAFAGILKFTGEFSNGLVLSEIHVPVSAQAASTAGLWVGSALVTRVANYLKSYEKDADSNLVLGPDGAYVVTGLNTNLGAVATPYPLRMIVHNDGHRSVLLQRVYYGVRGETNLVVATSESVLDPAHLDTARRITATHLPWTSENTVWPLSGDLTAGGELRTTTPIAVDYADQAANPFLHTYHPDHDNLQPDLKTQWAAGKESYGITRHLTFRINSPEDDFASLTTANRVLSGDYAETITVEGAPGATRTFTVGGTFALTRLTAVPSLTTR